jgi:hypothetical protein
MEELIARPRARGQRPMPRLSGRRQRGDILLVVMVFLLVCLLGLVVSMRENIVSALMGGNNVQRQRNVQVSDVALRQVEGAIQSTFAGLPLQFGPGSGQVWYRTVSAGVAVPDSSYWDSCLGNSDTTKRCGSFTPTVNSVALGTALAVVQPAGRTDATSCELTGQTATFYDVFIHFKEANGVTSSDTETVYRLCTTSPVSS